MEQAYDSINALNARYNNLLNGKWNGMMTVPPGFCALYHKKPAVTYTEGAGEKPVDLQQLVVNSHPTGCKVINLADFTTKTDDVTLVKGLGYDGLVVQLGTHHQPSTTNNSPSTINNPQSTINYTLPAIDRDSIDVIVYTVPFWPLYAGKSTAISISMDNGQPQVFENKFKEYDRTWKDQVMRNGAVCRLRFPIDRRQSSHTLRFSGIDAGQMLQRVIIDWGGLQPTYIGPAVSLL